MIFWKMNAKARQPFCNQNRKRIALMFSLLAISMYYLVAEIEQLEK